MSIRKKLLNKEALAHEFYRCIDSFISFKYHLSLIETEKSKRTKILCYNSYVDFLSHLYEFYINLIKRDKKYNETGLYKNYPSFKCKKKKHEKTDIVLREEVEKLMRNRKNRIVKGYKDNLGLNISFYDKPVPTDFGMHFRFMRNRRNHVDYKRINANDISLTVFYKRYHKFVEVLFEETIGLWIVDENKVNWKEIDEFAQEILK